MLFWILGLLLALVVALFANQNPLMIELRFFMYSLPAVSLTVIIIGSALVGALISFFFSGIRVISLKRELRKLEKSSRKAGEPAPKGAPAKSAPGQPDGAPGGEKEEKEKKEEPGAEKKEEEKKEEEKKEDKKKEKNNKEEKKA